MGLRMSGMFLFVMALMSACSTDSKSTDLHLGSVQPPTSSATHPAPSTSDPTTSTSTTVVAVTNLGTTGPPSTFAATTSSVAASSPPSAQTTDSMVPPSTTTEPAGVVSSIALSPEEVVAADYQKARLARQHCSYDPFTCDFSAIAVPGSPTDVDTREVVRRRTNFNLRAVEGKGEVKLRIDGIRFEGPSAFVSICAYDTVVIYDVADPSNPDDDIIENDAKESFLVGWELRQINGTWLLYAGKQTKQQNDGDLCGF